MKANFCCIVFEDGTKTSLESDDLETLWIWERQQKKYNENRRAKIDRRKVRYSYYVGCTPTGKAYGGFLKEPVYPCKINQSDLKCWAETHGREILGGEKPDMEFFSDVEKIKQKLNK